jgi:hypothetical protein
MMSFGGQILCSAPVVFEIEIGSDFETLATKHQLLHCWRGAAEAQTP